MASADDEIVITADAPPGPETGRRLFNRELSWLDFNARVLQLADDPEIPLLERLHFCGIWSSNLDEYFQVRVAGLINERNDGGAMSVDGMSTAEQLDAINHRLQLDIERAYQVFDRVRSALGDEGIRIVDVSDLSDDERQALTDVFTRRVFPVLTPLAVDPGHPFPYISNLSLNLGVLVANPDTGLRAFARVKVPAELLGRTIKVPDTDRWVLLEDALAANLELLFPGMSILEHTLFRVTRSADVSTDDSEVDDLMSAVESELRRRQFGEIVRLEVQPGMSAEVRDLLVEELNVTPDGLYEIDGPIDIKSISTLRPDNRRDLRFARWEPRVPAVLGDVDDGPKDFFPVLRQRDVLVHHPYVSFDATVLEFIRQASVDPAVLAIKLTLYRTSGDGRIVDSLIHAANEGKQVVVGVELKARFDEQANIEWAKRLERAGVHVTYGLIGLKVHSKIALVIRREADGELRRYCHVGTGNYNSKTARSYTDIGLLTADETVGADLSHLFNSLTGFGAAPEYQALIVAPAQLRDRMVELIRNEASLGDRGRIVAKMNSLVDAQMIEELYDASSRGAQIDLIVRGICCLRPGVTGMSENIRVRSILGRFLEHSRLYVFANGRGLGQPLYLIGSADLMPRNLDRRVEALVPVNDPDRQDEIEVILGVNLADDLSSWQLQADGSWNRSRRSVGVQTHSRLQELTS